MRPDLIALHHSCRAKPTGQTRAEYASAVTRPARRPYPRVLWLVMAIGFVVAIAAGKDWI